MSSTEVLERYLDGVKSHDLLWQLTWAAFGKFRFRNGCRFICSTASSRAKYAATTTGAHVVLIPRYGHVGYAERHNEKIAYLWLWAYKSGYFE